MIDNGVTYYSAYVAAKGCQHSWTQMLARELAPFGITVNNVAPVWIPVARPSDELLGGNNLTQHKCQLHSEL